MPTSRLMSLPFELQDKVVNACAQWRPGKQCRRYPPLKSLIQVNKHFYRLCVPKLFRLITIGDHGSSKGDELLKTLLAVERNKDILASAR